MTEENSSRNFVPMDSAITLKEKLLNRKFVILGVFLGVGFWFLDALVDSSYFTKQSFRSELLTPGIECTFHRVSVLFISLLSGFYFQTTYGRMKDAKTALRKANEQLEGMISERTAELQRANGSLLSENQQRREAEVLLNESIGRLSTLLQAIPDAVYFKDKYFRYRIINRATEQMLGRSEKEILGNTDECLMPPDLFTWCRKSDEETLAGRAPFSREEQFRDEKGDMVHIETVKIPILNHSGNIVGLVGVSRDVTEKKKAELALIEEKNKSEAILSSLGDAISMQDRNFRVLYQNEAHKNLAGDHAGEFCYSAYSRREDVCPDCPVAMTFRDGTTHTIQKKAASHLGDKHIEITSAPLKDGSGRIVAGIESVRDITHRHRIEDELRQHKEHLEEIVMRRTQELVQMYDSLQKEMDERLLMETKMKQAHSMKVVGELAAGVAHEVRNPLHAILSITEALKQDLKEYPDFDVYLSHINAQVKRLSLLMRDLLELGKPLEKENFREESVAEICASVVSLCRDIPGIKDHRVVFAPSPHNHVFIRGDGQRLQQVFMNLIENAAQHSPAGSDISVIVYEPAEGTVRIAIKDQGAGIPEDVLDRIYDPFFSTRSKGVGLGLNIVKNIVEFHGGSLGIYNNTPLQGCTAVVSLPWSRGNGS